MTPTATPACTPLAEGMAFALTLEATGVVVELNGLQPGELPVVILWQSVPGVGAKRIESKWAVGIGPDGRLTEHFGGLQPVAESTPNTWQVQVIHARGVACTDFTLPQR
jgi:hypothetical protein